MIGRKFDYSLKVVVVGDGSVGKTCLLIKYVRDSFEENHTPTLGVEFLSKIITTEKHRIQLQLWDTAGQELFRSVTRGYYRGSAGALLLFDLTNLDSFEHITQWLKDIKDLARPDVATLLLGNKLDIVEEEPEKRKVSRERAEKFAEENGMLYFETSAKTGEGILEAMNSCVAAIEKNVENAIKDEPPKNKIVFQEEPKTSTFC